MKSAPQFLFIATRWFPLLVLLLALLLASPAQAHRAILFAYAEDGSVFVEGGFPGGKPAMNCKVEVLGPDGTSYVQGQTDAEGRYAFPVPPQAAAAQVDLLIVLDAGLGHRAEWTVPASEYLAGLAETPPAPAEPAPQAQPQVAASAPAAPAAPAATAPPTAIDQKLLAEQLGQDLGQKLGQELDKHLERRLAPLMQRLGREKDGPGFTEIFGGIGWILGLVGIFAWARSRRA